MDERTTSDGVTIWKVEEAARSSRYEEPAVGIHLHVNSLIELLLGRSSCAGPVVVTDAVRKSPAGGADEQSCSSRIDPEVSRQKWTRLFLQYSQSEKRIFEWLHTKSKSKG